MLLRCVIKRWELWGYLADFSQQWRWIRRGLRTRAFISSFMLWDNRKGEFFKIKNKILRCEWISVRASCKLTRTLLRLFWLTVKPSEAYPPRLRALSIRPNNSGMNFRKFSRANGMIVVVATKRISAVLYCANAEMCWQPNLSLENVQWKKSQIWWRICWIFSTFDCFALLTKVT